jgi:hypothetical protein
LLSGGTVKCWGWNFYGAVGDNTTTDRWTPVSVPGISNGIQISEGGGHSCVLLSDGTIKCWGDDEAGELGDNSTVNKKLPVSVIGINNAIQIATGNIHTCAVLSGGTVKCWGRNQYGQLGDNTTTQRLVPVSVVGINNAVSVATEAGSDHFTCAVLSGGTAKCWGENNHGQLGDGTTTSSLTPVQVSGITNAVQIAVGYYHTCALLSDGTIKCWGYNNYGQLGDNTTTQRLIPVPVLGISNAVRVSSGDGDVCALLSDGTMRCWGYNSRGQLGDNTTTNRWIPTQVLNYYYAPPTCQSLGYMYGTLACSSDCSSYDPSGCYNQVCGNGQVEGTEECDDGTAQMPETCGTGACEVTVADTCVNCMNVACVPGEPVPDTCNGIDDDCDGSVDEELTQACYTGPAGTENVGLCRGGTQICVAGAWGSCVGEVLPGVETCNPDVNNNNNIDENCDGSDLDCGFTCDRDSDGYRDASRWYCFGNDCDDMNAAIHPDALELCNGIDDNCNEEIDENLGSTACGLGVCLHTVQNCIGGQTQICNPMEGATTETCNGLDDDCDGVVDNGCPSVEKMSVLTTLNSLNPSESEAKKQLISAIGEINKSLGNLNLKYGDRDIIWLDSVHLLCKGGHKAFEHEKKAVYHLQKAMAATKNAGIKAQLNSAVNAIVSIDRMLAQTAITQAQTLVSSGIVKQSDVDKANAALAKGDAETKPTNKIEYYKKAWKYANKRCALEPNTCIESITVKSPSGEIVTATGDEVSNILPSLETQFVDSSNANVKIQTSCTKCLKVGQSFGGWIIQEIVYKPGQETTMAKVCGTR